MAGNDTAALVVALSAQVSKFERDMQKADSIAERTVSSIEDKFAKINPSLGANFLKGFLPAASVAGVVASIKSVVDALAELGDLSGDYRIGAGQLQALSMGAQQARVSADELTKAMRTFTDVSKKSTEDGKDFYKALSNIGGGFVQAFKDAPTQEARLQILGKAMASTTDEVKRAQLGLTAFGSDSERVTGYIASLADGVGGLVQRAKDLGIAIDDTMVKQAQDAQTQIGTLANVISNQLITSIASLIPSIIQLLPYLEKVGGLIRDSIAGFASPEARPTATLKAEIADITGILSQFAKDREALLSEQKGGSNKFITGLFGVNATDVQANIDKLDQQSTKYKATLDKYGKILADRQAADDAAAAKGSGSGSAFKPRPKLNKDESEDTDAFQRAQDQIKKSIALTDAETASVGKLAEARERARVVAILEEAAKRSNTAAGKENTAVTDEQRGKINELADAMLAAAEKQRLARTQFEATNDAVRFFGNSTGDVLSGLLNKTSTFEQSMARLLQSLTSNLINAALTGEGAFAKILGFANPTGGVGGIFGALFGGFRAAGGPVTAGVPYVVGEKGPEIVVPKSNGTVIPNSAVSRAGARSTEVKVNNQLYFSSGVTPTDMAAITSMVKAATAQSEQRTIAGIRKGVANDSRFLG